MVDATQLYQEAAIQADEGQAALVFDRGAFSNSDRMVAG